MFMQFEKLSMQAGAYPAGWRENRFSERSPAAPAGPAKAGSFIPSKVIGSRVNSVLPEVKPGRGDPAAAVHESRHPATAGRSMKRFSNASNRLSMSARSALKLGEVAQTLFDIFAVGFLAAFASLLGLSVVVAFFILFFVWF